MFNLPNQQYFGGLPSSTKTYKRVVNNYQDSYRKADRQKIMKRYREQYRTITEPNYKLLNSIDLDQQLSQFLQFKPNNYQQNPQKYNHIIENLFVYARSSESDHMFSLFNGKQVRKMMEIVNEINIKDKITFDTRNYIRVLWIFASYICYAQSIQLEALKMLEEIYQNIIQIKEIYIPNREIIFKNFTPAQTRNILKLIFFCFKNMINDRPLLIYFCLPQTINTNQQQLNIDNSLITKLINQIKQIYSCSMYFKIQKQTFAIIILQDILAIFVQILKIELQEDVAIRIKYIFTNIIDSVVMLMNQFYRYGVSYEMEQFTTVLLTYFVNYLQDDPFILISKNIEKMDVIYILFVRQVDELVKVVQELRVYHSRLEIEGQILRSQDSLKEVKDRYEKKVMRWLEVIEVIYAINIPSNEFEELYYEAFDKWTENYMIPKFTQLLNLKNAFSNKVIELSLSITSNMLYEVQYVQDLLQNNQIMASILYYLEADSQGILKVKKEALSCIHSLIRVTESALNGKMRKKVLNVLNQAGIIEVFANNIGYYVDIDVNKDLLQSLHLYLKLYQLQNQDYNALWIQFCSYKGEVKLQNYLQKTENEKIKDLICTLLDHYKQQ